MNTYLLKFKLMFIALVLGITTASAQNIRYVKMATAGGNNANDGLTWETAKADIQDAINDLVNNNQTGEVWVAAGTYYPTESTESSGSQYYKAFKIPAGITVRGGFAGTETGANALEILAKRSKVDDKNFGNGDPEDSDDDAPEEGDLDGEKYRSGVYENKTILCGDLTPSKEAKLTWNEKKQQFDAVFFGNTYHVVWFAMNGFGDDGRANPLTAPAKLEGCVIEGGHAYTNDAIKEHPHQGYGGGIYMVANSFVYNSEVKNCDASRNGGGIYMDGGGIVRRTYVHDCQALGIGTEYGLGGGICEDGSKLTSKSNPVVVAQSAVTNCVGRQGGGMALMADKTVGKSKYAVVANSTLVNNNTATVEAGGVYTYKGGGLASMTIVRNKCNGSGVTLNGVVTGRSGGVYSRDAAYIGNNVIWGNECAANNDVQYASSRTNLTDSEKTHFYYNAVSNMDLTDWSGCTRMGVLSLYTENEGSSAAGAMGYPLFFMPTPKAGYYADVDKPTEMTSDPLRKYINWTVSSESYLTHSGITTADLDYEGLTPAPTGKSTDMKFNVFNSRPTLGAFISQVADLAPAGSTTYDGKTYAKAFYVDPAFIYGGDNPGNNGASWNLPARFLGNVLDYIKDQNLTNVVVFVKEGTVDNTRTGGSSRIRQTSLDVPSGVTLIGSFDGKLTGTNVNKRNVVTTPTVISGKLLDQYKYNVAHLINIKGAQNVTLDGFKITLANAESTELANTDKNGAAITLTNCAKVADKATIHFKNIIVSNSQAACGAAVYADASAADFENCIFHNNTTTQLNNSGVVYATNGSALTFNHCDVLRNVGHASYLGGTSTNNWTNSIFYGNMDRALEDTNYESGDGSNPYALAAFSGNTAQATGAHCMFDAKSASYAAKFNNNDTGNQWQYNLQYKFADGAGQGYPRFINPTKNSGYSEHGDVTYYGRATSFEPHNNNPVVNKAAFTVNDSHTTWGVDIIGTTRDFGGLPDIGAVENHKTEQYDAEGNLVENAYLTGQPAYGEGIMYVRQYAGETFTTANLTEDQQKLYDGSSWDRAIVGNAMYDYAPGTITTTVTANTYFQVTQDGTGQSGYRLKLGSYYLTTTGNQLYATTNENEAAVWNFSTQYGGNALANVGNSAKYIWTEINGTRYYMGMTVWYNGGYPNIATSNTNDIQFTVAGNNTSFRFYRTYNNTAIYLNCTGAYDFAGTTTRKNYSATKVNGGTGEQKETPTDADAKSQGNLAANAVIGKYTNLHVYNSLTDLDKVKGKGEVSYNIALYSYKSDSQKSLDNSGNEVSEPINVPDVPYYIYGSSSLSAQTERATSGKYVLINAGTATFNDKVYIYDIVNSKYVAKSGSTIALSETVYAWWIKDSGKGYLSIIDGTTPESDITTGTDAWSMATVGSISFADRSANAAQLVMVNTVPYEIWNKTDVTTYDGTIKINGLQYAVNMSNKNLGLKTRTESVSEKYGANTKVVTHTYQDLPAGKKDAEVWVAAGTYSNFSQYTDASKGYPYDNASKSDPTDYTAEGDNPGYGYLVRNHVKVYGGFPSAGNPGMDERRPQLSRGIAMSKANQAAGLDVATYETILQTNAAKTNLSTKTDPTYKGSVLATPYECAVTMCFDSNTPRDRVVYEGAEWDGFTLQYGYRKGFTVRSKPSTNPTGIGTGRRVGGGGACLYENIVLRNCVVRENGMSNGQQCRGGGVYCDGGILENCYLLMNETNCTTSNFGGGMYMIQGTIFNSVVAGNNLIGTYQARGAGIFLESAKFYNNTIVNNTGGTAVACYNASKATADLIMYNTIVIAADGQYPIERTSAATPLELVHCYVKSNQAPTAKGQLTSLEEDPGTVTVTKGSTDAWGNVCEGGNKIYFSTALANNNPFVLSYTDAVANYDYRIEQKNEAFNCVNAGTENIGKAELPDFDMDYTDRIQDCTLDIGAYEYNGAYAITPNVISGQAIFYVTPNGYGTSAGNDPENAACAAKLQKILDAAGRYKYVHPETQVIVKVANSYDMQHPTDGDPSDFRYYATRTTDYTDQDVRVWSIEIPRGVEVWGGYTDIALKNDGTQYKVDDKRVWNNTYNGFTFNGTDRRDITKFPTYFDSYYYNKDQKSPANTYHVVSFTDRVYDPEGYAYLKGEESRIKDTNAELSTYRELASNDESQFVHMSTKVSGNVIMQDATTPKLVNGSYASNRAVIDGIFITGGAANGSVSSTATSLNVNGFGGAAIVPDFGYVRNCVVKDNSATNGGALALTNSGLVSGSLIMNNNAENMGGGIYVFEDGAKLSNGMVVNTKAPAGQVMDYNMAHVLTSTIVNNKAQQGGGIWYTNDINANARFNSVAVWRNTAPDQSNVYGMINPEQPTDDETLSEEFYPFSYSVIESMRASGTNNMSTASLNRQGIRFVKDVNDQGQPTKNLFIMATDDTNYSDFGYYGLSSYSILCSNGMPKNKYDQLKMAIAIADNDIIGVSRTVADNNFVEVGARALPKQMPQKQLMLRLFVAHPEDVDTDHAQDYMSLTGTPGSAEEYYSQKGSSFAYPFNFLQDALDYIKLARNGQIIEDNTDAQNLPFEILVGKGTYYPKKDLNGETKSVWAHTYAIPEGVTIMGGFNPMGGSNTYYGRYYKPKSSIDKTNAGSIYDNVDVIPTGGPATGTNEIGRGNKYGEETVNGVKFQQWDIQDIADRRAMDDINKNGIIEPWEFKNQTIISGNAVNGETDGVYHVMTAVADANAVGNMPKVQKSHSAGFTEDGYHVYEEGQQIRLNGLVITGGNALTYLKTALDDYGSYIYYQGAGLQVDGNRYNKTVGGTAVFYNSAAYGVGYRDIPVSVTNCQFRNNIAGYGGAISTNGSLSLFASSFEQNLAIAQTETPEAGEKWYSYVSGSQQEVQKVMYPGQGGAILATHQLSAFNTLFANNEARLGEGETPTIAPVVHPTFRVPNGGTNSIRAAGGAIMMGSAGVHHIVNCDFVRNKANAYPAVFTMNPTVEQNTAADAVVDTHDYSQIINTVAWGNEVNKISSNANYLFASKLMVNVGKKTRGAYNPEFTYAPASQADLDNSANNWMEANWFCAYEEGVGFTPNNTNDLRDKIVYSPKKYAPTMIMAANEGVYQNCNLQIVADNNDVAGPNFRNPSVKAGFDGFMEGADWSPARFNRLTDNGNGWIKQSVDNGTLAVKFHNDDHTPVDGNETDFQGAYPVTHYISGLSSEKQFPEYKLWLSLGNEKYMQATNDQEPNNLSINGTDIGKPQKNLPRISPDPTLGVEKAYIDIGVYEYYKQPLLKPNSEVDILWVSTKEHPENGPADGSKWNRPTSDLQRAIETLLSSRNGNKKEIRIMDGEYAPVTPKTVAGTKYNAFVIDTKSLNASAITPSGFKDGENNDQYYAQSITIKGGYSSEIMYEYDPVQYKTVIRQNETVDGVNTDHLIYIVDPTVRYAGTDTKVKNDGATFGDTGESGTAKTMPIQIDGVTLINDKAEANKPGSAIYYPDNAGVDGMTSAHKVSVGGEVVYYPNETEFKKIDPATGKHNGTPCDYETEFALINDTHATQLPDPAKILITKTEVIGSGKPGDVVDLTNSKAPSAVYIGKNGGSALIYNTVFHSNYGMPLDAYNTVNVNNTFAKNTGMVRLQNVADVTVKSQMHNSALWKNNETATKGTYDNQVLFGTTAPNLDTDLFTYNSFTGCEETGNGQASTKYNTRLTNDNGDLASGPNFIDPENEDIFARNFDIKPSVRLLNKGNDESITSGTGKYFTLVVNNKYDFALASTTDKDVLNRPRLAAKRIDIGAYEFQGSLIKVLYVDPNKSHNDAATGENWDNAFGYGDLQNAVDLAGIAHMTSPTEESYVFVKGASSTNKNLNTNETLTIRDGVTVYGSIISSYTDWHAILDEDGTTPKYVKKVDGVPQKDGSGNWVYDIDAYIKDMTSIREGVASDAASKTIVTGIKTSEFTSFNGGSEGETPALVDGFVITPVDETHQPTAPVLDVTNNSEDAVIVVRNVIVAGNDLSNATGTNVNVAQVSNGLIYEVLMRDNMPKGNGAVLQVSNVTVPADGANPAYVTKGYAVNVTVEGKTVGADGSEPVDGMKSKTDATNVESATQIFKSITNSINSGTGDNKAGANAPYGAITNKGISGYFYNIADPNLNYQLTETSKYIDMCDATNPLTTVAPNLAPFINYATDRDILGNPRLLSGLTNGQGTDPNMTYLDRGAFETWRVDKNFICGDEGTIAGINVGDAYALINKHFYPHDGSVVYVMNNKSLVIDPVNADHEVKPTPENPGFLLIKEGANFYGNGRPATCAYVAVERTVPVQGAVVSVPYAMDYKTDAAAVNKDVNNDLVLDAYLMTKETKKYSGGSRSDWKYVFQKTDSKCWENIVAGNKITANNGVYYLPSDDAFDKYGSKSAESLVKNDQVLMRFTGKGASLTDYIYTESTDAYKTVTLTKYDDSESTNHGADYTDEKDMGWNCIGLPYLVSEYQTYSKTDLSGAKYQMNIPHEMWLYYDGTVGPDGNNVNGHGGYYSVESWESSDAKWHVSGDATKAIWVGEGIFMQTATLSDSETLTFYRPVAPTTFTASGAKRYYFDGGLTPDEAEVTKAEGVVLVATEWYTTEGKRLNPNGEELDFNRLPMMPRGTVIVVRKRFSDGSVKSQKFSF